MSYDEYEGVNRLSQLTNVKNLFGRTSEYVSGSLVEYIDNRFVPKSIKSIVMSNVYSIPSNMFSGMSSLENVTINTIDFNISTLTSSIGMEAFKDCINITSITINDSDKVIKSIGASAFDNCKNLTSFSIPENVTIIGNKAFKNCERITSIVVPESVTTLSDSVFADCIRLERIEIKKFAHKPNDSYGSYTNAFAKLSVLFGTQSDFEGTYYSYVYSVSDNYLSRYIPNSLKTIKIDGLYSVPTSMFEDLDSLTNISLELKDYGSYINYVTPTIGNNAFKGLTYLNTLTISGDAEGIIIESRAFEDCKNLSATFLTDLDISEIKFYTFKGCEGFENVSISNSDNDLTIADNAFYDCPNIKSVTFDGMQGTLPRIFGSSVVDGTYEYEMENPYYLVNSTYVPKSLVTVVLNGVNSVAQNLMNKMSMVQSVTIELVNDLYGSYTSIGNNAFREMSGLTSLTFEGDTNRINSIGEYAFYGCSSLEELQLDFAQSVTVGGAAFANCSNLKKLSVPAQLGSGSLYDCNNLEELTINAFDSKNNFGLGMMFNSNASITNHSTSIPVTLKKVTLLSRAGYNNYIPAYMFYNAANIEDVVFDSIDGIGQNAFAGTTLLEKTIQNFCVVYKNWIVGLDNADMKSAVVTPDIAGIVDGLLSNIEVLYMRGEESDYSDIKLGSGNYYNYRLEYIATAKLAVIDGNTYVLQDEGEVDFAKLLIANGNEVVEIPTTVRIGNNNYPVKGIYGYAFTNKNIKYIIVPQSIESFDTNAFYNNLNVNIKYIGTSEDWANVIKNTSNLKVELQYDNTAQTYTFKNGETTVHTETGKSYTMGFNYEIDGDSAVVWCLDEELTQVVEFPYFGAEHTTFYAKLTDYIETNDATYPFQENANGFKYSSNKGDGTSSTYTVTANRNIEVRITYGVSSEQKYDKFTIMHNSNQVDQISGSVSDRVTTVNMSAGDTLKFTYSKDNSNSNGNDNGWFKFEIIG